jgi:hypothetical protein
VRAGTVRDGRPTEAQEQCKTWRAVESIASTLVFELGRVTRLRRPAVVVPGGVGEDGCPGSSG